MSTACRDWLSTLWPASFKGVPFYFEQDKEEGGRGLVVHTFPNRDDPYVEDLGEEPRYYSGSAYVHGDNADILATALKAALASRGPGTLVVPYFGPVTVHCQSFERATRRDQMGYIAFEIKCVRKGADSGLISVPLLQNVAFLAADNLVNALGQVFPLTISTLGRPDLAISAVTDTLSQGVAALDLLRQSYAIDPTVSAQVRDAIAPLVGQINAAISNEAVPGVAASAAVIAVAGLVRQTMDAIPAASATRAALELAAAFPAQVVVAGQPYLSPTVKLAADNAAAATRAVRLAAMIAYAEAVLRTTFASRPDGVTARGEVSERFENELYETDGAENAALFVAIEDLRGKVIDWLGQTIATLAPVITVESNVQRPALDLAWILYADPLRADELVARNNVRNPFFMPREISALSR